MYLILFLIFITNSFCQPGPTQTQEAGISNYQILPTSPTTTPIVGKQYLYNANNVLSTKDSAGTINRVNKDSQNILANPDFEQNLDSYTFTAGRAVVNTALPLFEKRSVDLDTTALNDNISTIPYLLPIGLQGQTCMAKIIYSGGDANLTMRVMNADNVLVGFKVLAVAANPTPAFITFNCPLGSATVNQRTLRIDVIQNSATNAALATLDNFYLGEFVSNQMVVSEGSQWYFYTSATDINGNFPFPAPTDSKNDKTLFNYTGTGLQALKPIKITIGAYAADGTLRTGNANVTVQINCIIAGVGRNTIFSGSGWGSDTSIQGGPTQSRTLLMNIGDVCAIVISHAGTAAFITHVVEITATPLPQLATIVSTNQMRAGWLGQRTWSANAGCSWTGTSGAQAFYAAVPACAGATNSGLVVADAVTDGQKPKVTLSKLPKGRITVKYLGTMQKTVALSDTNYAVLYLNGVTVSPFQVQGQGTGSNTSSETAAYIFVFNNPTDLTNATLEIAMVSANARQYSLFGNPNNPLNIVVSYEPDLSDAYTTPELFAVLPPQVQNSNTKEWTTESCIISNNGTATLSGPYCNSWINSLVRNGPGDVTFNFKPNIFSAAGTPLCLGNSTFSSAVSTATTATSVRFETRSLTTGALADANLIIFCQGLK